MAIYVDRLGIQKTLMTENSLMYNFQEFACRKSPSYSRMNFLLHLRDVLKKMQNTIASTEANNLPKEGPIQRNTELPRWVLPLKADMEYLRKVIDEQETQITTLKKTVSS